MNAPVKHSITGNRERYNYLLFDSAGAFDRFVDLQEEQLNPENQKTWNKQIVEAKAMIDSETDWYGTPTPAAVEELETHCQFLGMHLLKKLQTSIRGKMAPYMDHLSSEVMPKPRLCYNDRGLGMFSFDRASLGLIHNTRLNTTTPLDQITTQLRIELGKLKVLTRIKKVYSYFKDKAVSLPSLRLYLMAGANARIAGDEMLYAGLACAELVGFVEQRGVATEVNVLLGTSFNKQVTLAVVTVKRFQDCLDKNQLLLISSDPRYFRFKGFKALIALSNCFNLKIPPGLGRIEEGMGRDFVEALDGQRPQQQGFVFEQSYSLEAAAREVTRIIEEYKQRIKK